MADSIFDPEILRVHTSDLLVNRRCRRKFDFSSYMRRNLQPKQDQLSIKLWLGTGFHFALQDYRGWKCKKRPSETFQVFVDCWPEERLPAPEASSGLGWEEWTNIMCAVLDYYVDYWEPNREFYVTYIEDGEPQLEVPFEIPIYHPNDAGKILAIYAGKLDGILKDEYKRLWVSEIKTAKAIKNQKLVKDFQVTAYTWAARLIYGVDFEGVVYEQFLKDAPKQPHINKNGSISRNQQQRTTYRFYRDFLKEYYGGLGEKIPWSEYHEFLESLKNRETPDADPFIQRDLVRRNDTELDRFEHTVQAQVLDIIALKPPTKGEKIDFGMYPNPTQDCGWECDFEPVCEAMMDGSDHQLLLSEFESRKEGFDWEENLPKKFKKAYGIGE